MVLTVGSATNSKEDDIGSIDLICRRCGHNRRMELVLNALREGTQGLRDHLGRSAPPALRQIAPERPDLDDLLRTYLGEVEVALDLLQPCIPRLHGRVLEVGAGIGAVSACLAHLGLEVLAIEPGGAGFEDLVLLQGAVDAALTEFPTLAGSRTVLPIGVEDLDPDVHGHFGVVFSANVLEHVADPVLALDRMQAVLANGGVQTHVCPNYAFPYEPHFFVPLLPFRPSATRWLLPRSMTETGLWASLNFVTARQVRRWASRSGVEVRFVRGMLAEALDRFVSDPVFAQRHGGLGTVVRLLRRLGLV